MEDYFRQYGLIAIFSGLAIFVPTSMLLLSRVLAFVKVRPRKPNPVKYETYECGMQTIGGQWMQFNFRYYMYAILFVIFDVEIIFIYPWAIRFGKLGLFAFLEMMVFMAILVIGWLYAWRKGALEWR